MPLTRSQLESFLWGAAELLRGQIDASDYKQYIFPLLFFKRLSDVYDEEYRRALDQSGGDVTFAEFSENHRFIIPAGAHWTDVRQVTTNVGQALQAGMREIERANPDELFGVFGDAQWTNKDRLPDRLLLGLVDHFSRHVLSIGNVPEDELGDAYEYLIKKFADDSGHTAAEFYTNRTVVRLMTQIVDLQPGETIYDPTCGSGGMLLNAILDLKARGAEHRGVKAFGQEVNLITSAIARMNLFLHDIEEFDIRRGDTLADPKFTDGDRLRRFDVILANPPYSVSRWDRDAFAHDPWGRNRYGIPPQSNADYAFFQHIIASLKPGGGRAAILYPHGVLFRDYEQAMRRGILEDDLIEAVIGIGPNLFYNSSMEACVVVLNTAKARERRGRVLLIDGKAAVTRRNAQSWLSDQNLATVLDAWHKPDTADIARLVPLDEIAANNHNLGISLYIAPANGSGDGDTGARDLNEVLQVWQESRRALRDQAQALISTLRSSA